MDEKMVLQETQDWLDKAVIGLNLCPFAKSVRQLQQIRFQVSQAEDLELLAEELRQELQLLADTDPAQQETTLLIHPQVLTDFLDFNDFLEVADLILTEMDLEGQFQIASFHPYYQFSGTQPDDIENYTNRAPYPILHLLRERSIEKAVASHPEPDQIFQKNIETLKRLGHQGWRELMEK